MGRWPMRPSTHGKVILSSDDCYSIVFSSNVIIWLVVSTHLKTISQNGNLPPGRGENKHVWNNHHLVINWLKLESWLEKETLRVLSSDCCLEWIWALQMSPLGRKFVWDTFGSKSRSRIGTAGRVWDAIFNTTKDGQEMSRASSRNKFSQTWSPIARTPFSQKTRPTTSTKSHCFPSDIWELLFSSGLSSLVAGRFSTEALASLVVTRQGPDAAFINRALRSCGHGHRTRAGFVRPFAMEKTKALYTMSVVKWWSLTNFQELWRFIPWIFERLKIYLIASVQHEAASLGEFSCGEQ